MSRGGVYAWCIHVKEVEVGTALTILNMRFSCPLIHFLRRAGVISSISSESDKLPLLSSSESSTCSSVAGSAPPCCSSAGPSVPMSAAPLSNSALASSPWDTGWDGCLATCGTVPSSKNGSSATIPAGLPSGLVCACTPDASKLPRAAAGAETAARAGCGAVRRDATFAMPSSAVTPSALTPIPPKTGWLCRATSRGDEKVTALAFRLRAGSSSSCHQQQQVRTLLRLGGRGSAPPNRRPDQYINLTI